MRDITAFLTLMVIMLFPIANALELDLIGGPGYADIKEVTLKAENNVSVISISLFESLPKGVSLIGRLYINSDLNPTTGSKWINERGADYLIVFTQKEGILFKWKKNRFERLRNVSVSSLGETIDIRVPSEFFLPKNSEIKLWIRTTIADPTIRSSIRLSALTVNYTTIVVDGVDNLPPWMDLMSVRGWLRKTLRLLMIFRGEVMPVVNSSSIEVVSSYSLLIDSDGNPATGILGAEYSARLLRVLAKRPFLELMIAGELYKWNSTSKRFDILVSEFPGYVSGNLVAYSIPLKDIKLGKEARIIIVEPPSVAITDYFPDGYLMGKWYRP